MRLYHSMLRLCRPSALTMFSVCAALLSMASLPLAFAAAPDSGATAAQNQAIAGLLEELSKTRSPHQAAISPDGQTVAWVAPGGGHTGARIFLRPLNGAATHTLSVAPANPATAASCSEGSLRWSPDSHQLAFLSDCATPGQDQIFLADIAHSASTPRQVTALKGYLEDLAWSPDGKRLGFLFVENATRPPSALAAIKPLVGVISASTIAEVQRVVVLDLSTGNPGAMPQPATVTPAGLHVYEFAWSPDGKHLAYTAAAPPGDDNWWVAQLYTQAVENGTPRSILKPEMQIAVPRWSPDGKQIAFVGGLMSDRGETGGDLYLIPAGGGSPRNLTPGRKASVAWPHWLSQTRLGFTEVVDGQPRFSILNPATGKEDTSARVTFAATVGDGVRQLSLSIADPASGTSMPVAALIETSFQNPPEVWAGPLNHLRQVTHLNAGQQPDWGRSESLTWTNEGFRVQGWLLYPKNYDPAKKYPLILYVHGGPANQTMPRWPYAGYNPVAFSTVDDFVLMPNPRGSFGEGEAFTRANRKDFGYGDLRDLLAGVDTVAKRFPVDTHRVGITGWSYGGFMTMFAITQTHRFRAAVAGAGISDWKSYYGENSIDQWMIPYFGASVYDDPAVYAKSSAINFIKNVKTPTLIVVGERDGECPAPQSFEMWHALDTMHVPVSLVVYPNEGHGFVNRNDSRDVLERAVAWFSKYMPAEAAPAAESPR